MPYIEAFPESTLLLDSDVFTLLRNRNLHITKKTTEYFHVNKQFPAISAMVIFEARFGIEKELVKGKISQVDAEDYIRRIDELVAQSKVLPFDQKAAETAAFIFARLSKSEKQRHWRDVFIVATAVSHNFALATKNETDMKLIANCLPKHVYLPLAIWKDKK